ncbi:hypothetical protein CYMTET_10840 [Cymbomonas tetramitiformis]|uniref:Uncharacterized protein n=1 Tax=Cymbomonas tetramitiformis TaxID=36881 RepID=A0AAE0GNL3_9CHLO|nr:hypothetical protein CYMTET_10840 [Cymbomonas tetramitiformis]
MEESLPQAEVQAEHSNPPDETVEREEPNEAEAPVSPEAAVKSEGSTQGSVQPESSCQVLKPQPPTTQNSDPNKARTFSGSNTARGRLETQPPASRNPRSYGGGRLNYSAPSSPRFGHVRLHPTEQHLGRANPAWNNHKIDRKWLAKVPKAQILDPEDEELKDDCHDEIRMQFTVYNDQVEKRRQRELHLRQLKEEFLRLQETYDLQKMSHNLQKSTLENSEELMNSTAVESLKLRVETVEFGLDECFLYRKTLVHMEKKLQDVRKEMHHKVKRFREEQQFHAEKTELARDQLGSINNRRKDAEFALKQGWERYHKAQMENEDRIRKSKQSLQKVADRKANLENRIEIRKDICIEMVKYSESNRLLQTSREQTMKHFALQQSLILTKKNAGAMYDDLRRLMRVAGRNTIQEMLEVFTEHKEKNAQNRKHVQYAETNAKRLREDRQKLMLKLSKAKEEMLNHRAEGPERGFSIGQVVEIVDGCSGEMALKSYFGDSQLEAGQRLELLEQRLESTGGLVGRVVQALYCMLNWLDSLSVPEVPAYITKSKGKPPGKGKGSAKGSQGKEAPRPESGSAKETGKKGSKNESLIQTNSKLLDFKEVSVDFGVDMELLREYLAATSTHMEHLGNLKVWRATKGPSADWEGESLTSHAPPPIEDVRLACDALLRFPARPSEYAAIAARIMRHLGADWLQAKEPPPLKEDFTIKVFEHNKLKISKQVATDFYHSNNFRVDIVDPFRTKMPTAFSKENVGKTLGLSSPRKNGSGRSGKEEPGAELKEEGRPMSVPMNNVFSSLITGFQTSVQRGGSSVAKNQSLLQYKHSGIPLLDLDGMEKRIQDEPCDRLEVKQMSARRVQKHDRDRLLQQMEEEEKPEYMRRREAARRQMDIVERLYSGKSGMMSERSVLDRKKTLTAVPPIRV